MRRQVQSFPKRCLMILSASTMPVRWSASVGLRKYNHYSFCKHLFKYMLQDHLIKETQPVLCVKKQLPPQGPAPCPLPYRPSALSGRTC